MKTNLSVLMRVLMAVAMVMAWALGAPPAMAQNVSAPGLYDFRAYSLTGLQATVASASTVNPTNAVVRLFKGAGIAVFPSVVSTNTSDTGTVTFTYSVSPDGTNYATQNRLTHAVTLNGTNTVIGYTNFSRATGLDNAKWFKLVSIQSGSSNTVTIGGVTTFSFLP